MENINKSGPSEKRREELRLLMQKVRESGKLGGTGMMNDMNEGGSLEGSASARNMEAVARPLPPPPAPPSASPPPISSEVAPMEEQEAADSAEDLLEDGRPKSTDGVGGRWVPPAETDKLETLKPKVCSARLPRARVGLASEPNPDLNPNPDL